MDRELSTKSWNVDRKLILFFLFLFIVFFLLSRFILRNLYINNAVMFSFFWYIFVWGCFLCFFLLTRVLKDFYLFMFLWCLMGVLNYIWKHIYRNTYVIVWHHLVLKFRWQVLWSWFFLLVYFSLGGIGVNIPGKPMTSGRRRTILIWSSLS